MEKTWKITGQMIGAEAVGGEKINERVLFWCSLLEQAFICCLEKNMP